MNQQQRDHRDTGRFFIVLFTLAFIYMGALSAALEGWDLMFTICSWSGMSILIGSAVYMIIKLFRGE
jgi:hypothetical protein